MDTESPGPEGPPHEEDPVTTPPKQEDITALVQELEQSFREDRQCEASGTCPNVAHWYMVRSCGCPVFPYCDGHRWNLELLEREWGGLDCRQCRATVTADWAVMP